MEQFSDLAALGSFLGVATIIGIVVQLFVKPMLTERYPKDEAGMRPKRYGTLMNAVTGVLGIVIAVTIGVILEGFGAETIAWFTAVGIFAAGTAIGGYEATNNLVSAFSKS